ncbi:MAG: RHS repeat-associated core domain-containing protein [Armatimonadetes bacterium]|nr:RHS repeat-associated core domain-containing protein [Armatimonadota bacterium]
MWKYLDYVRAGSPEGAKRVFQAPKTQQYSGGSWSSTSEEFHFAFDSAGRLTHAAFAQTASWTPGSGQRWYDNSHPATRRARARYLYDPAGRASNVEHYWDIYSGGAFTGAPLLAQDYTYSTSTRLRTATTWKHGSGSSWATDRTEYYGYDSSLDYLVNVDYNDGISNEYQTWTYDDAGNRASDSTISGSWTYDNLNRMTASPGYSSYTNDILGNRTARQGSGWPSPTPTSYTWDALNRMTYFSSGVGHDDYIYRADGMRVYKNHVSGLAHEEGEADPGDVDYSARFFYDGQMQVESKETYLSGNNWLTKYGIGARGIDYLERSYNGGTATVAFPIYDGHGNMIATIGRSTSSPYYSVGDQREYDVWGRIRAGNTTGDPKNRYCANLGHVQDDESGLIYMRARYYEPWTGRFVSEDSHLDGRNWYVYALNNPVACVDADGHFSRAELIAYAVGLALMMAGAIYFGLGFKMKCDGLFMLSQADWRPSILPISNDPDRIEAAKAFNFETQMLKAEARGLIVEGDVYMRRGRAVAGSAIAAMVMNRFLVEAFVIDEQLVGSGLDILDTLFGG